MYADLGYGQVDTLSGISSRYLKLQCLEPFWNAAFWLFVVADLATTAVGLSWGWVEKAPGAYLFGNHPVAVLLWLILMKFAFFSIAQILTYRLAPAYRRRDYLIALYSMLAVLGLLVSAQNLVRLAAYG